MQSVCIFVHRVTFHDVSMQHGDVLVAVAPRVFVIETQSVQDLMHDVSHGALRPHEHRLLSADTAHERSTTTRSIQLLQYKYFSCY